MNSKQLLIINNALLQQYFSILLKIDKLVKYLRMIQQIQTYNQTKMNEKKPKMTLISFDEDDQLEVENQIVLEDNDDFSSDPVNQFQNKNKFAMKTFSIISEGQKSKIQRRNKVQEYINYRKTLGLNQNNKIIAYREQQEFDGALIGELGNIQDIERQNNQVQLFILAFNQKPENAINDYIKKHIIRDESPQAIAQYLIKVQGLDKQVLGQYFGKNMPHVLKILHSFCTLLKFNGVEYDKAIRHLLARFRLPGQSQQIQRIIWQFSLSYYEANTQQYQNADQLFPLAYAIIMLATDAHNPKQEKKMTKQQFIKNTQFACPNINGQYLAGIYDRITKQKFQTQVSYMQTLYARLRDVSSTDIQSVLKLTKQLMKGDVFLKICWSTKKFVQRRIYLSNDERRIQWVCDPDTKVGQQPRFINISDIIDLTLGLGSEVMKRNNVPQQFDSLCFTITTYYRSLDLKAKTNKQRAKWINYIRAVLIHRRSQKIKELEDNYKLSPDQVQDIWNTEIFPHWDDHWDYKKKKPKHKNVIVRGFQSLCGCFSKEKSRNSQIQSPIYNARGIKIKSSILDTLWALGLPHNSRKILWPLVIGNNLAITPGIVEQMKKRSKQDSQLRKFSSSFDLEAVQLAQTCRQFRPDIPAIRDLIQVSEVFLKVFPKNCQTNPANALLNELHLEHFLSFYRGDKNQIDSRIKLFEYLLEQNAPGVRAHFKGLKLETKMYLVSWFLNIFYECFSSNEDFLLRVWDNFLLQGQIYLFKVGLAIVKYYQVELKMCTFHQGLKLLRFPKQTSMQLFFKILQQNVVVKQQSYSQFVEKRKNAVIKTKVQAIPLQ